ncbi:MAG: PIN domain-containing protein [bacterium]
MNGKFFLDTNILVYSFDKREKSKQVKARALIGKGLSEGSGIISYQVIQEFLNVATRKFEKPLGLEDCKIYLNECLMPLCEIYPDIDFYNRSLEIKYRTNFSLYDSMIIQAALEGECETLFSDDLHDGYRLNGMSIVNPFHSG